jgi:hypothetical protein
MRLEPLAGKALYVAARHPGHEDAEEERLTVDVDP